MTNPQKMNDIHTMTNREVLMKELDALDNEAFEYILFSRQSDLPESLETLKCEECKHDHGGSCPLEDDDDACILKLTDWLSHPCKSERLILEAMK